MTNARRQLAAAVIGCAALVGGCSTQPGSSGPAAGSTASAPEAPALELTLGTPVHHLDGLAREPMLAEHPGGALFLTGYPSQITGTDPRSVPNLWRSDDQGATWARVRVGTPADGAMGNSDVDLAVAPDGTIYFVSMGFDRAAGVGTHVAIGVSTDVGASWSWSLLSETTFDDRPWVEVAPDGTAHVIWNDAAGVSHAVSNDGGQTWTERVRIHPQGGSSHLAIGPAGEIAVRITPIAASGNRFHEGVDLIAVSTDAGVTWQKYPAPGRREWGALGAPGVLPRWVEPLAWGPDGSLFSLWSEGETVQLARSLDRATTWTTWPLVTDAGGAFYPYLVAGPGGRLAATWFAGTGDDLAATVALIQVPGPVDTSPGTAPDSAPDLAADAAPRLAPDLVTTSWQPDSWLDTVEETTRNPAGEYLPVAFLASGDLAVAAPVQDAANGRYGFSIWRIAVQSRNESAPLRN